MKGLQITCEDCMELMERYPDKYFDLAIVDPPYGSSNIQGGYTANSRSNQGAAKPTFYNLSLWELKAPNEQYFKELFRISKAQIIWGANHFISKMPIDTPCWVVWDKKNENTGFADCELAWCSLDLAVRKFEFMWNGMLQGNMKNKENRIHPTQKPVALYKWLLTNYAKPGNKILDTHMGSGSIAIACYDMGFELTACELDPDYYRDAMERIRKHTEQQALFTPQEMYHA